MLRKIQAREARIGMYVHEVCGSWLEHAFWRSSFLIRDGKQLARLAAAAGEIVIDTDKGLDIEAPPVEAVDAGPAPVGSDGPVEYLDDIEVPVGSPPDASSPLHASMGAGLDGCEAAQPPAQPASTTLQQEIAQASRIVAQSREAMQSMFNDVRMGKAIDTRHCLPLVDDITQSVARNPGALVSLARLKTSDDYTYMHSVAVCGLMIALSRQLGLDEAQTREAGLGGLVHDLGKALMPLEVLNKPGALTPAEFAIMKGHPEAGHRLLVEGRGVGEIPLDICLHHHEKVNGEGYPKGLQGERISLFAKMGAVCDVYDAITSNRPYKAGWDPAESIQKMAQWARDGQFDERIFQAFVKSIGIYPTGSLVKLKSGRLAVVVEQGRQSLLSPVVRAFHADTVNAPRTHQMLDLGEAGMDDKIVSREAPSAWGLGNTDRFWLPASS